MDKRILEEKGVIDPFRCGLRLVKWEVGSAEAVGQPGAGDSEVTFDGWQRHAKKVGRFGAAASQEGAELDELGLAGIDAAEFVDGRRQVEEFFAVGVNEREIVAERHALPIGAPLL